MNRKKKLIIFAGGLVALLAIVGFTVKYSRRNVVEVQTGRVERQDLASVVTASGEIKPKMFVNVGANAYGKITRLYVKEGERVRQGQLLAQLENVQSAADVAAMSASMEAAQNDAKAASAALNTALADLNRAKADQERTRLDYERAESLYKAALIAKAEYDNRRNAYEAAAAGLAQGEARISQMRAQKDAADRRIAQARASLDRASDALSKTTYAAPFEGVVTNLPVREGESVVVGIQNAPGSTLMTIADMSVITAEVKVDETDIVNVQLGQGAEVSIDAIPRKTFKGRVSEIGNNAVIRSSGISTAQATSGSQEAKDFKVVITLDEPPENLRPGLSATAKITTATRENALSIPIQALTIREKAELEEKKEKSSGTVEAAAPAKKKKEELQGVFVVRDGKAQFVQVETGITGTTDIEVTTGLKEDDRIVTGSYKVLRSLRNGASVKEEKKAARKEES